MSKKGLGRGLGALISEGDSSESGVKEILLADIEPNPEQPRRYFSQESLEELASSLRVHGLLQPILVKPAGDKYFIIAGERRFRAAQIAGFEKIPCIVQDVTQQEMTERALVENIQRADLSPIEEGLAYARLMKEYGLTQEQVAQRVGKGRPTIANLLRVIQLPEPILDLLREEKISLGHAKLLLSIKDSSLQVLVAQKAAREKLSVRETEELINKVTEKREEKKERAHSGTFSIFRDLEDKLRSSFQTKVRIKGEPGRGKIEIEFFSEEELNRLLEMWNINIE